MAHCGAQHPTADLASHAGLYRPQRDALDAAEQRRVAVQQEPQSLGERDHPLAHLHLWEHVLDEMGSRLGHAPRGAGRAEAAALAGEGDHEVVAAVVTACAGEAAGKDAALEIGAQLALDVPLSLT